MGRIAFHRLTCESMGAPVEAWAQVINQPPRERGQTQESLQQSPQRSLSGVLLPNPASEGFRFLQVGSLGLQPNHIGVWRECDSSLDSHLYADINITKSDTNDGKTNLDASGTVVVAFSGPGHFTSREPKMRISQFGARPSEAYSPNPRTRALQECLARRSSPRS
jgi:hypothetical protein